MFNKLVLKVSARSARLAQMLAMARHTPLNPWAKEWTPSQPYISSTPSSPNNAGCGVPLFPPGLSLRPGNGAAGNSSGEPCVEAGLAHQRSLGELQFDDMMFSCGAFGGASQVRILRDTTDSCNITQYCSKEA